MQAKKNILIPIFILIIIASICFIIISFKNKNNISDNTITNSALTKEYNIDGILIYDIKLYVSDNVSKLMAKVKNANKDDVSLKRLDISFYDKEDNLIISTIGLYDVDFTPNDIKDMNITIDVDLSILDKMEFNITKYDNK